MGIDVVHGRKQFLEDREIVGDDHARLLVGNHLFNRNIEEFSEVFEMVVLQGDLDTHVVPYFLSPELQSFEGVGTLAVDDADSFGELVE